MDASPLPTSGASPEASIARSALIVGLGNVGSRVLGLVREQVVAGLFGATAATDAFRVAFRVPLTLYDLLVGGMISAALVPVFSGYLQEDKARQFGPLVLALAVLLLLVQLVTVTVLALLAGPLMDLIASGYEESVRRQSAELLQVLLPALVFMGLSGLATGVLYAQQRFGTPSIAVMAFNLGIILLGLSLHRQLGIVSLAVGVLAGAVAQLVLQLLALRGLGVVWHVPLSHPGVAAIGRLYLPVALGLLVSTAGVLVDTSLASRTGEGSLAAMGFATTLVQFPLGLVAAGVSSAALPVLARHQAGGEYQQALSTALRLVLLTILPATVGLVLLRRPIIRLLFQHGVFDAAATERTAMAFLAYSPGLPAAALDQVLIQGFYARRNTLTPVLVGVASVGVYLLVALSLLGALGMPGLALANSAQWTAHVIVMGVLTHRAAGGLGGTGLGPTALRAVAGSAVVAAFLGGISFTVPDDPADALLLGALIPAAAAIYLLFLTWAAPADLRLLAEALQRGTSNHKLG